MAESSHQQYGRNSPPQQHRNGKLRQICQAQPCLAGNAAEHAADQQNDTQAKPRTEIEQASQQLRPQPFAEQQLGQWGARAEQNCGAQRERHAGASFQQAHREFPQEFVTLHGVSRGNLPVAAYLIGSNGARGRQADISALAAGVSRAVKVCFF